MATATSIELLKIVRDMELQPRAKMDQARIVQYAEDMLAGCEFPPIVLYFDGETYWLSEGFHRCAAATEAEFDSIDAEVREGTRDDAMVNSLGSNKEWDKSTVGMKRLNADIEHAVRGMLAVRWDWPNTKIAKHIGVSDTTVGDWRKRIKKESQRIDERLSVIPTKTNLCVPEPNPNGHIEDEDEPESSWLKDAIEEEVKPTTKPTFNSTNDMVDWARWTWNPVTGCEHTCFYCYARDIANRFYPEKFTPTFRSERLEAPRNSRLPEMSRGLAWKNVFVCSMADLFGRWVPDEWIEAVFESCRQSPEWNYLFLTKFPQRYERLEFPETSWVGTTVDEQKRVLNAEKAFRKIEVPVKWLSVEPMLEPLRFSDLRMFDWVVIGGCSRSTGGPEFFPNPRWVLDLTDQAIAAGCKVYWKENISPKVGMFKEYPDAFLEA